MKYEIFVSTVHGEIIPVDVDSVEKLENMTVGEFSRKGLDGADQSLPPPEYGGIRRRIKTQSLEAPRPSMEEEEHNDDYRITRDLQDDQTQQDYDIEHKPTRLMVGHRRERDRTPTSADGPPRPLMQEEEKHEEEEYMEKWRLIFADRQLEDYGIRPIYPLLMTERTCVRAEDGGMRRNISNPEPRPTMEKEYSE